MSGADVPATAGEALRWAEERLDSAGVGESLTDARLLLAHAVNASPTWVHAHPEAALSDESREQLARLVARRERREPVQHLLGHAEFWSMRLAVSPDVLVPRPETETLVEVVLRRLGDAPSPRLADVGIGSGCIAFALLAELPLARVVGSDVSEPALAMALANARALGFDDRLELRVGHLLDPLIDQPPFDALAANLPYVGEGEWRRLEPEVRDYDPRRALVGGLGGVELIREAIVAAPRVLEPDGVLALEVGAGQAPEVAARLEELGWRDVETASDLAGIDRVVSALRPRGGGGGASAALRKA